MIRNLTFFTSNPVKLSHARYIAEPYPVSIVGFRERTYHAGYHEPRLTSRSEILAASYDSAKEQLSKAKLSVDSHPFILEDTSVRIDALSTEERDIPGVDIKYWMQGRSFGDLNESLKRHGDCRSATVRSDVLFHVPKDLRASWSGGDPYLIFEGAQRGTITTDEVEFETNPVFPWLDNQTFNKWFVPMGENYPLGSLPIGVADKYDFRRKAFEGLFEFLISKGQLSRTSEQLHLALGREPPTILFCGPTCAGKTTASQHLARDYGFLHLEASDFMHLSYHLRHGYDGGVDIGDFAESALEQKPLIAAEKVVEFLRAHPTEPIVVSGFRAPGEVEFFEKEMPFLGRKPRSIFIEASQKERFDRGRARGRPGDDISFERFCKRDAQQDRMGLSQIRDLPSVECTPNQGTKVSFLHDVGRIAVDQGADTLATDHTVVEMRNVESLGLEESILLVLLSQWESQESREFYSTTEVAKLIQTAFPNIKAKHKDNVSRFFNQDYSPLFDVNVENGSGTRRFRLSNTGFGIAAKILREKLALAQSSGTA